MARKDLQHTIATTFLTGAGLKVAMRIVEEMMKDAMKAGDADQTEQLGKVRGDLRKLGEKVGG